VVALVGPTASGKSRLAHRVALAVGAGAVGPRVELVSVDSMAVYRGMDIGTAKPTPDERRAVPYHLLDLVDPGEEFSVRQFQAAGRRALDGIAGRGHAALLVGGTGLHLRSLVDDLEFPGRFPEVAAALEDELATAAGPGELEVRLHQLHGRLDLLDPVAAGRISPTNRRRLVRALEVCLGSGRPFSSFGPGLDRYPPTAVTLVGLRCDRAELDRRIGERFARLMDRGLLEEVRALAARPGGLSRTARQALGYRELLAHVEQGTPLDAAVAEAVRRTRSFARRQLAWFRRDPRIVWMDPDDDPTGPLVALCAPGDRSAPAPGAVGDCPPPP
jgi:tRNA dimethylallyltransferase